MKGGSLSSNENVKPLLFKLICVFVALTGVPVAVHLVTRYYLEQSAVSSGVAAAASVQVVLLVFTFYAFGFVSEAESEKRDKP